MLTRPPATFYLGLWEVTPFAFYDGLDWLLEVATPQDRLLIDEVLLRQEPDPAAALARVLEEGWEILPDGAWTERLGPGTLLDLDPNAAYGDRSSSTARWWLLKKKPLCRRPTSPRHGAQPMKKHQPQPPVSLWPDPEALGAITDLYQITMMAGYHAAGMDDQHATFELFVRRLPPHRSFLVFAGLEQAIGDLMRLAFSPQHSPDAPRATRLRDDRPQLLRRARQPPFPRATSGPCPKARSSSRARPCYGSKLPWPPRNGSRPSCSPP